jgi:hypothetical protein
VDREKYEAGYDRIFSSTSKPAAFKLAFDMSKVAEDKAEDEWREVMLRLQRDEVIPRLARGVRVASRMLGLDK